MTYNIYQAVLETLMEDIFTATLLGIILVIVLVALKRSKGRAQKN